VQLLPSLTLPVLLSLTMPLVLLLLLWPLVRSLLLLQRSLGLVSDRNQLLCCCCRLSRMPRAKARVWLLVLQLCAAVLGHSRLDYARVRSCLRCSVLDYFFSALDDLVPSDEPLPSEEHPHPPALFLPKPRCAGRDQGACRECAPCRRALPPLPPLPCMRALPARGDICLLSPGSYHQPHPRSTCFPRLSPPDHRRCPCLPCVERVAAAHADLHGSRSELSCEFVACTPLLLVVIAG